jgi:hypothetical protein
MNLSPSGKNLCLRVFKRMIKVRIIFIFNIENDLISNREYFFPTGPVLWILLQTPIENVMSEV